MNVHKNARTTLRSRADLVRRVRVEGATPARVARGMGVSVRTVHKWLARHRDHGYEGLADRSSRPVRSPRRTPAGRVGQIKGLRLRRLTATAIAAEPRMPLSTVCLLPRRLGLARAKDIDPPEPPRRYERARPGELVHVDIKKLARVTDGVGHRITGRRQDRRRGAGWELRRRR